MKHTILTIVFAAVFSAMLSSTSAMPGKAHNRGTSGILETPAGKGGAKSVTPKKVKAVHDWMDNPSQRMGPYHNAIRHNPRSVSRALSGTGKIDLATLNVARLHKIQDVANNVKPVDGWKITEEMRQQARKILEEVQKNDALPKKLPSWVDKPGPLLDDGIRHTDEITRGIKKASVQGGCVATTGGTLMDTGDDAVETGGRVLINTDNAAFGFKALSKVGRLAGPAGGAVEIGYSGTVAYNTEMAYQEGKISEQERTMKHAETGGSAAGGVSGAVGGAKAGAAAGTAIGACFGGVGAPVGAAVGGVGGAVAGGIAGDWLGGKAGKAAAEEMTE